MPPPKRGPRFSVQDVIAAIQNGESEFEMESEDSDTDMSEEEADEDACGHMDKENQQPNDPPVSDYVDIEPQQHKPTKPRDSTFSLLLSSLSAAVTKAVSSSQSPQLNYTFMATMISPGECYV
ncbi:NADH-ubiquinone oxidoreductase chain 4 [Dissostichus eleginoides]|uniref:NADH-ubiquinone oxidoreductase chain 4 n=1 Tax=Dissostichus eleginoides TaxID=100907 RepID=A0AAD9CIT1_DISEL|nr:NADH-ubiquinone oxidoreductase chain 4 [Dissostichus eleginoides]